MALVWVCDRCQLQSHADGRKNQRPAQWATAYLNRGSHKPDPVLLCEGCATAVELVLHANA